MAHVARSRRLRRFVSILILATPLLSSTGFAVSPTFVRTDYPVLGNNHVAGDLNGDGVVDLAGSGTTNADVMLGNGDGSFRPKVLYPAGGEAQDIAIGDFNRDGRPDLVVTINNPEIGLSLLTGHGDGTFAAPVLFPNTSGSDSPSVVAVDLNNDLNLDVVVAHQIACFAAPCVAARTISVMLGNGDGTFQPSREIDVGTGMSRIAVADFDFDGFKDLAISGDRAQLYTLLGSGDGTFVQQPTITLVAENTLGVDGTDVDVADVNGDATPDLVVAIALNGSRTAVLEGNGDGTFGPPLILTEPALRVPQYQAVADYNGDGFQDLALSLAFGTNGLVEIRDGNGDGTFQQPVLYFVPAPMSSVGGGPIVSADFNGDAKPDIALAVTGANPGLAVAINSTGSAPVTPAYGTITVSPSSVVGGSPATITVNLVPGAVAPSGGFRFDVSSSNTSVATVPSSVLMPAGGSSVNIPVTTRSVTSTRTVSIRIRNNQLGRRTVSLTVTPAAPAPVTLSALSLSPSTVTGGANSQGTVTLSGAAAATTTVTLASSSGVASVPASVTIPAGASSASFTVTTTTVTATTTATISAALGGVTRSAALTINPAAPSTDTVTITRAEYDTSNARLRVEATSTSASATLQAFNTATGQLIGTLANEGGGRYRGEFNVSPGPQSVTVRSSLGGVATRSVVFR